MLLLAVVLIVIGVALVMAPHYGGPPPLALVGWVCLVLGLILLVIVLVGSADGISIDAVAPLLLASRLRKQRSSVA
jgi:membrane-bound ClpP family serine protease